MQIRSTTFAFVVIISLCVSAAIANDTSCPVMHAGEQLLKEYDRNPVTNYSSRSPRGLGLYTYQFPLSDSVPSRDVDYLVDPIMTAQQMMAAEKQAAHYDRIGAIVHAKAIRKRIARSCELTFGRRMSTMEQKCMSVAERLKDTAWKTEGSGNLAFAEKQYRAALAIYQKEMPASSMVGNSLADVARVCEKQDKHAEAIFLLNQALAIYDKNPGSVDSDAITAIEYFANLIQPDDKAKSGALFKRVIASRQKLYKTPSKITAEYVPAAILALPCNHKKLPFKPINQKKNPTPAYGDKYFVYPQSPSYPSPYYRN
jgi:tetratricopeptide (TPR) repeat protein